MEEEGQSCTASCSYFTPPASSDFYALVIALNLDCSHVRGQWMTEGVAVGTLGAFRGCWVMEVIQSPIMHVHGTDG